MDELTAGLVIADRYRLDRLLGEGGMGAVWAATHLFTRGPVALKFMKPEAAANEQAVKRFIREARAATAVNHPNVLQVHDIFRMPDGSPVMVMDLLVGESFGQLLARARKLELAQVARIMLPVTSAVGSAHSAGIVHRDLKPDNIFLEQTATGMKPRVLDFGIAKLSTEALGATQSAELTRTGALLGTPYYMSPEQVFGEKDVDARADVWSVGVILYEALTGTRPVDGENLGQLLKVIATGGIRPIREVAPYLPEDVCQLIERMLTSDRARRCADLREAFSILQRYTSEQAQSFSEVRLVDSVGDSALPFAVPRPADGSSSNPAAPSGVLAESAPSANAETSGAFTRTDAANIPMRRTAWPALAAGAAVLAVVVGGVLFIRSGEGGPTPAAASAELTQSAAATVASGEPAEQDLGVAAPPSSPPPTEPSASAAPSTSEPAKIAADAKRTRGTRNAASASAAPTTPPAPAPTPAGPTLGGVATAAPF